MSEAFPWRSVLELDERRQVVAGDTRALADAVRRGADLRVFTQFVHGEHIDPTSNSRERISETIDFRVTYLLEDRWTAGVCTLRQPIDLPVGFGPRPSMSFFMYNQDGTQAVARPYLDGGAPPDPSARPDGMNAPALMPKMHVLDVHDEATNAPSRNFVYDFHTFRYNVCANWRPMLAHTADGAVTDGSIDALVEAFQAGCEVKVAIAGLCDDLAGNAGGAVAHEVFVHLGSLYYYHDQKLFVGASHPVVRIAPAIPLRYARGNWDFGWLMPRSDGYVAQLICNPQTLKFRRAATHHAMRWFAR